MINKRLLVVVIVVVAFLCLISRAYKKYQLMRSFGYLQERELDFSSIAEVNMSSTCGLDYVEAPEANDGYYNEGNNCTIGLNYNWLTGEYERIVGVVDIKLEENCELVKVAAKHYETDLTYLAILTGIGEGEARALVYRKIDPDKNDFPNKSVLEYMMWKQDKIRLVDGSLQTRTTEQMNLHMF